MDVERASAIVLGGGDWAAFWLPAPEHDVVRADSPERTHVVPRLPEVRAAGGGLTDQWRDLVTVYFGQFADEALRVMACESSGDPNAYNAGNIGLMQIHEPSHRGRLRAGESLYDPETNIRIAADIWRDQSWVPWACKP